MTKLSIIIAAYNVGNYIKRTLTSINDQTTKQFELIVVDDGSTDATNNMIKEILRDSQDVEYRIITQNNGGVSSARNKGLMNASGEYVMFLDGDDYIAEDLVEKVFGLLDCQVPDVICWGYDTVREDETVIRKYFDHNERKQKDISGTDALKNMIIEETMWIATGSAAFRKGLLEEYQLKYEAGCSNGEDQEFAIKVLARADRVVFIDKPLTFYVDRKGSISNSNNIKRFDAIGALVRTREYLRHICDNDLDKIAETIDTRDIAENYFNNLESCLNNAKINPLLNQINKDYPALNQEIRKAIKAYDGNNRVIKMKCRLYLVSPELYASVRSAKRFFDTLFGIVRH